MIIEELIKQKAKEYLELSDTIESYYGLTKQEVIMTAFADGAEAMREIANTWIPVEEEMPEHKKLVLVKGDESGDQIPFLLGWYYGPHWFVIGEEDISFGEATHWKHITP